MKDFVIVGTGPSAFFLTKTLLEQNPDAEITVLEAGKNTTNPDHPLSNKLSNAQEFRLKPSINIGYGGTSQLWHNVLAPLDEEDFEYKSWIPLSGWPIKKIDLEKHYKKTANFFNFGGVFLIQWLTGKIIYYMGGDSSGASELAYRIAFLFVAILLFISLIIYLFSSEKKKHF